ncbi:glycoside hydrolase family 43 protein [Xylariomycetidae sp. FL0641]|nr:glycoside hydrolase family 43 protein [Xylariomycetidae sp. FL0641]
MQRYDNSTLTLTSIGTPDPYVTRGRDRFYLTFTTGDRIEIWSSRSLADIESTASRHIIWTPPPSTDHTADLWAPELHALRGRWYVYYAAAHPGHGNKSHRMYVLGGPAANEDPCRGPWEFLGRIHGTPDEQWAIDGTVFEPGDGHMYLAYSGWPADNPGNSELVQQLWLTRLEDPTSAATQPVMICAPDRPWEITTDHNGDHAINEGPQFLRAPDGSWRGLVYSCAGSWTSEYKMATLQLVGGDPLEARNWKKSAQPLVTTKRLSTGPYGPGHGSFLEIKGQVVAVYHATDSPSDGWENRKARVQRVAFTENGPYMGKSFNKTRSNASGLLARVKAKLKLKKRGDEGEQSLRALLAGKKAEDGVDGHAEL